MQKAFKVFEKSSLLIFVDLSEVTTDSDDCLNPSPSGFRMQMSELSIVADLETSRAPADVGFASATSNSTLDILKFDSFWRD